MGDGQVSMKTDMETLGTKVNIVLPIEPLIDLQITQHLKYFKQKEELL